MRDGCAVRLETVSYGRNVDVRRDVVTGRGQALEKSTTLRPGVVGKVGSTMSLSAHEMRQLYRATVIVRKPTYGIIKGYHELPYICLGPAIDEGHVTTKVVGRVQVSPRFVIRPSHLSPSYEEIFGAEHVDAEISGRLFGFMGFPDRPMECKSELLEIQPCDKPVDEVLATCLEDLERREDITTGIIVSPNNQYFPISVERFIGSVLADEFSV